MLLGIYVGIAICLQTGPGTLWYLSGVCRTSPACFPSCLSFSLATAYLWLIWDHFPLEHASLHSMCCSLTSTNTCRDTERGRMRGREVKTCIAQSINTYLETAINCINVVGKCVFKLDRFLGCFTFSEVSL